MPIYKQKVFGKISGKVLKMFCQLLLLMLRERLMAQI